MQPDVHVNSLGRPPSAVGVPEVGVIYWTDLAPDIFNSGREEQGSISV